MTVRLGNAVGGASGLAFVTGATFTTATSFSLPTDTFASTYKNYRMIVVFDCFNR
jgi:hypothetical protein